MKNLQGMNDLIGLRSKIYSDIIIAFQSLMNKNSIEYIETPILEDKQLFSSAGESSDIVLKEMYSFESGRKQLALRPEGTASVVRSFINNKLYTDNRIKRFYYLGQMFRNERPQKGRYRQFTQFGIESFGSGSSFEDFYLIKIAAELLNSLGIEFTLEINSIGCTCREDYNKQLKFFVEQNKENFCELCNKRKDLNVTRINDCKNDNCQSLLTRGPRLNEFTCEKCNKQFKELKDYLLRAGIVFNENPKLVRGLDYYSQTVFEFKTKQLGAQDTIIAGGRYDNMLNRYIKNKVPAIGFAVGIDRLIDILEEDNEQYELREGIFLAAEKSEYLPLLLNEQETLNKSFVETRPLSLKKALQYADKSNSEKLAYIGEREFLEGKIFIKDLKTGENFIEKNNMWN